MDYDGLSPSHGLAPTCPYAKTRQNCSPIGICDMLED